MFDDSQIAQDFHLRPCKLSYLTNWGLAPYFKDRLKKDTNDLHFIFISFDEFLIRKHRSVKWMFCFRVLKCGE